jgi:hypothetical protein
MSSKIMLWFEAVMAVKIHIVIFWVMIVYSGGGLFWWWVATLYVYPEDEGNMFL